VARIKMEASIFEIFWLFLIAAVALLLFKSQSTVTNDSKSVTQEPGKFELVARECEICNQPIPKERLAVVPDSIQCLSCKEHIEKKQELHFTKKSMFKSEDYDQSHFSPYDDFPDELSIGSSQEYVKDPSKKGLDAYNRGDYDEAIKWFQLSYDYYHLGIIYENGLGVSQDCQEAAKLYWKASHDQNVAGAQVRLGRMYQDGRGMEKSFSGAMTWYDRAKKNCRKHEKSEILDMIASNIKDMESESKANLHVESTLIDVNKGSSAHPKTTIEFYDNNNYELDILSVAAGKTKDLIDQYQIHSCPYYYNYERTRYITFRAGGTGEMDALYEIIKILIIPSNERNGLEVLESQGLDNNEVQRLINYMKKNPFQKNDRYYILNRVKDLPDRPRPFEVNAKTIYYSLDQLLKNHGSI
jgi:hypothetical protein